MFLNLETLATPQENLAMDEALVEVSDRHELDFNAEDELQTLNPKESFGEVLRIWELKAPCVVLGRASKWNEEACFSACEHDGIPILRRVSGGASIVAGPGCLMYSVLLSYRSRPSWRSLDVAHREVMARIRDSVQQAIESFGMRMQIEIDGTCDLTIAGRKFSGNALRCKRNWMIYHGTILYSMPLRFLKEYLLEPSRQPAYRMKREHDSFVTNLLDGYPGIDARSFRIELEKQLTKQWSASDSWNSHPFRSEVEMECDRLLATRYLQATWHQDR